MYTNKNAHLRPMLVSVGRNTLAYADRMLQVAIDLGDAQCIAVWREARQRAISELADITTGRVDALNELDLALDKADSWSGDPDYEVFGTQRGLT